MIRTEILAGLVAIRQGVVVLNLKGRFRLDIWKNFFYNEGCEALEWIAQRGGWCPLPGGVQGQVGQGSEQPNLAEYAPAPCRRVWLDKLYNIPSNPNYSMILQQPEPKEKIQATYLQQEPDP